MSGTQDRFFTRIGFGLTLDRKGLPNSNTVSFYKHSLITGVKSCIILSHFNLPDCGDAEKKSFTTSAPEVERKNVKKRLISGDGVVDVDVAERASSESSPPATFASTIVVAGVAAVAPVERNLAKIRS